MSPTPVLIHRDRIGNPRFTLRALATYSPARNAADLDRDLIALRKAGLPG